MKFTEAVAANPIPGKTLVLEPWVFADEWSKKPQSAVCTGIRILADKEKTRARITAQEMTNEHHKAEVGKAGDREFQAIWIETYNDTLMRQIVAMALCDPNNVKRPFELMPYAEVEVSDALSSKGVELIFRAIDRYEIESSPAIAPAGDEEIRLLRRLLPVVDTERLSIGSRRLLAEVVDELDRMFGDQLVDTDSVDEPGEEVPIVVGQKRLISDHLGD